MIDYARADLTKQNTMALPCIAERYLELSTDASIKAFFAECGEQVLMLGGGSNVILPPVIHQPVLRVGDATIEVQREDDAQIVVRAGAAVVWDKLVAWAVEHDYYGIENLSLIPGSVGAAPVQNIGAYGVELKDTLNTVRAFDREKQAFVTLDSMQCEFAYRDSIFKRNPGRYLITEVSFVLSKEPRLVLSYGELQGLEGRADLSIQQVRDMVISVRSEKLPDPSETPNTGSFFKNPVISKQAFETLQLDFPGVVGYPQGHNSVKVAAGWLIEQAGLKAKQLGAARVHDRQALVLTNIGGAHQADILDLAELVRGQVKSIFGVELEIEPVVVESEYPE